METKEKHPRTAPDQTGEAPSAKRSRELDDVDRLSDLPDALLHSVISSLPAWQAVQTSVLSRRWRYLWRSAPILDVDGDRFMPSEATDVAIRRSSRRLLLCRQWWEKLENFTTNLLMYHGAATMERFRLHINLAQLAPLVTTFNHNKDGESQALLIMDAVKHIGRWVLWAAAHHPVALELSFGRFASIDIRVPPLHSAFHSLRRLHLIGLVLDSGFADHLRGGKCPVLEDLELRCCTYFGFKDIVSSTLESLTIDRCAN